MIVVMYDELIYNTRRAKDFFDSLFKEINNNNDIVLVIYLLE